MKLILLAFLFTGCGKIDRIITHWTGGVTYKCSKAGVEYVQSDSGLAVHLDRNGKTVPCEED